MVSGLADPIGIGKALADFIWIANKALSKVTSYLPKP